MENTPEAGSSATIQVTATFPSVSTQTLSSQITFQKSTASSVISANSGTFYGFYMPGTTNIQSGSFGLGNYVIKIAPNTNYAYNLVSSNKLG